MKINKFFLMGAIALGLVACKSEDLPDNGGHETYGNTYMSISINVPGQFSSATRATEDGKHNPVGDWGGQDQIDNISVYLISEGENKVQRVELKDSQPGTFGKDGVFQTKAWKTTPGNKKVYVIVNNAGAIKAALDAATAATFEDEYNKAHDMIESGTMNANYAKNDNGKDIILMSGLGANATIAKNVKEEEVYDHATNNVKIDVRRIVARAAVTMNQALADANGAGGVEVKTTNGSLLGKLKNLQWTVAQYEKKTFVSANSTAADKAESPNYDWIPTTDTYVVDPSKPQVAGSIYDYSLLKQRFSIAGFTRNADNKENVNAIVGTNMQFITETTHPYGNKLGAGGTETGYRRGNTTYVMVTGTFIPEESTFAEGEFTEYTENATIYLGTIDGKFYVDKDKAIANNKQSDPQKDGVIEYKTGKMYYFAWVNPDALEPMDWKNSPVVRNNIYHVNIAGFKKLGFSGNPYNPQDPNNPDPDKPDPDEPTPGPDDPIYDQDTYMATEITVINWGMHSYDITF